jgi:cation transport regulator ChaB
MNPLKPERTQVLRKGIISNILKTRRCWEQYTTIISKWGMYWTREPKSWVETNLFSHTTLDNLATRHWQTCYKTITNLPQDIHKLATRHWQTCYKTITNLPQDIHKLATIYLQTCNKTLTNLPQCLVASLWMSWGKFVMSCSKFVSVLWQDCPVSCG